MITESIYNGPPASYIDRWSDKRYIAIHNTSNDASAAQEASYAKRRKDRISAHYYADDRTVIQSLDTDLGAYHAGSTTGNWHAIAYEITGRNSWTRQQWIDRVDWPLLGRRIAWDCKMHGIPVRVLTVEQMRDNHVRGIVTHDLMRRAWGGTTHTDPGPNFPMDLLIEHIQQAQQGGTAVAEQAQMDRIESGVKALMGLLDHPGTRPGGPSAQTAGGGVPISRVYRETRAIYQEVLGLRAHVVAQTAVIEQLVIIANTHGVGDVHLDDIMREVDARLDALRDHQAEHIKTLSEGWDSGETDPSPAG